MKSPAVRLAIRAQLRHAGFPREEAEAWADGWADRPEPEFVAAYAATLADHAIPLAEAIEWHRNGFNPHDAIRFRDVGYTQRQATTVEQLAMYDVDEWVATGLPAERVLAYLRAGVGLDEVAEFEGRSDEVEDALAVLAAFLG